MQYAFFWVIPRPINFVYRRFGVRLFPYKYPNILNHSHSSYPSSHEDGTDRVFRNVGIQNSDAGELPRRKHTTRIQALFLCDKFTVFTYVRRPNKLGMFKVLKATWLIIQLIWECKIVSPSKWFLNIRTASPEELKP